MITFPSRLEVDATHYASGTQKQFERRLCVADAYRLNQNRSLPKDHPSFAKGEPRLTSASVAWRFLDIIKRSGVVPDLEAVGTQGYLNAADLSYQMLFLLKELDRELVSMSIGNTEVVVVGGTRPWRTVGQWTSILSLDSQLT